MSIDFQGLQEGVRQVLMAMRFEALLRDALARRLQGARFDTDPPRAIAVALAFYGVQAEEGRPQMLGRGSRSAW